MLNKSAKLIWLSSYPKSGNTWLRLFLSALFSEANDLNINDTPLNQNISSRSIIDSALGMSSANLPESDYLKFRSRLYFNWARDQPSLDKIICKVHDACILKEEILFPPSITRGTIYILRNPFDIVASMANHFKVSIDKSVHMLCSNTHGLAQRQTRLGVQLSQHLGTWGNHVDSWVNVHAENILIIKYEDLIKDSLTEFGKIIQYAELGYDQKAIEKAIVQTSFKNLQEKEKKEKFKMTPKVDTFFRQGKSGQWRNEITQAQAQQIIDVNYDTLLKFNYIDSNGNILV
ncbi:sulfotransferase domain-containing protein [Pedobacter sp. MC2016-14]|uniref:sulfotransferase domain-containing protein n=1 Tax=Pedobacter sp. MC2016-14 TaxID=2897327 RepID=UPI001E2D6145|nr:sulfotransferase domain-containing protein [Pedobacter sp. MC2016-14]MCD0486924.1 sulfotransferase domain-containing protein [Pedobacter sp. MC2016-14]